MKKTFATISLGIIVAMVGLLALPATSSASWGFSLGLGINNGSMGGYGYGYPSYYNNGCNWGCNSSMYQSYPMYQQPYQTMYQQPYQSMYQQPYNSYMNNYSYPVSNFSYNTYDPYYDIQPVNYGRTCYRYC